MSVQRCVEVDRQCRGSNGKVKIEGYMSIFDEEAHQCLLIIKCQMRALGLLFGFLFILFVESHFFT